MRTTTQLEAAMAKIERNYAPVVTAPEAHAAHQAYLAGIDRISRQQAEAIKTAPGYSHAMGCFLSPKAEVAFINDQIEADRVSAPVLRYAAE